MARYFSWIQLRVYCVALCCAWVLGWAVSLGASTYDEAKPSWAFLPPKKVTPPEVRNQRWPHNEIDQFILRKLEERGLKPSPQAEKRTLIRRLSFNLRGLPPSPEEVEAFTKDHRLDAWEQLVDTYLASPRYGERWARHWLDLAHFGETHGYDKDKARWNAWPYRDYVIASLNEDKPYSRFVAEQIAGDALFPEDPQGVIATGFLAAGPWDYVGHAELPESKTDGLIARYNDRDDMIMTAMSSFMSLTVHCARCHNHKFDPISQREYYNLQAVFAGTDRADRFYDTNATVFAQRRALHAQKTGAENRLKEIEALAGEQKSAELDELLEIEKGLEKELKELPAAEKKSPSNGYHSSIEKSPSTTKWVQVQLPEAVALDEIRLIPARPIDFPDTPGFGFPPRFKVEVFEDAEMTKRSLADDKTGQDFRNPGDSAVVIPAEKKLGRVIRITATRLWERTADYVFALAEVELMAGGVNVAGKGVVTALDSIEAGRWSGRHLVDGFDSRKALHDKVDPEIAARRKELQGKLEENRKRQFKTKLGLLGVELRNEFAALEAQKRDSEAALAKFPAPQWVYAAGNQFKGEGSFKPASKPRPVHLLRRGEVKYPREPSVPGALGCVPGFPETLSISEDGDGARRAALAKWLIDERNFFLRRSIVNRVWQYHFGKGLVDTPNDFGKMGSAPSHPELLDWLAIWFQENGESIKKLNRLILATATYRQSAVSNEAYEKIDQDNRLLWRGNRPRLDAESYHDAILSISGKIDFTIGGPSVRQFYFRDDHSPEYDYTRYDQESPGAYRRSIYRFIVRSVPDPFMETLDCPDASLLAPSRNTTVTALQALVSLNDPFIIAQCRHFASRLRREKMELPEQIDRAVDLVLNRAAQPREREELAAYARQYGLENACRVLLNANEFLFVD